MTPTETTTQVSTEQLHVLPVSILESHSARVAEFLDLTQELGVSLGWHYILDLAWSAEELLKVIKPGSTVLDAGAGTGLMQWWLAGRGVDVISVDRMPRQFSRLQRAWCPIVDFRTGKRLSGRQEAASNLTTSIRNGASAPRQLAASVRDLLRGDPEPGERATVRVLEGDLMNLHEIASGSVDAVVSISSLEHNQPEDLARIVPELMRIIRPGGALIATLGAAETEDWFHKPSSGWCYTDATFRRLFDLSANAPSNFADYATLFDQLKSNAYLRENLSDFYFDSDKNGMPFGRWDPQYQSAGVVKVKRQ